MKTILVFSQSPKDIQYVLAVITHKRFNGYTFDLIVTSKECYAFLSTVNFFGYKVNLLDFSLSPKSKVSAILGYLIINRVMLYRLEKKYRSDSSINSVFFFSSFFDLLTISFYLRNKKFHKFCFVDIFKINRTVLCTSSNASLFKRLKQLYLKVAFSRDLEFFWDDGVDVVGGQSGVVFDSTELNLLNPLFLANRFQLPRQARNSILVYDSDYSYLGAGIELYCKKLLLDVMAWLACNGFDIYVKEHPRLGGSGIVGDFEGLTLIEKTIPSEFIDRSSFNCELAISSAALERHEVAGKSISLIKILELMSGKKFPSQLEQMESIANVKCPTSLESLFSMCRDT